MSGPTGALRRWARSLIDVAWREATESKQVPSTLWADRIIDRVDSGPLTLVAELAEQQCSRRSSLMGRECYSALSKEPRRWCAPCICKRIVADRHPADTTYWAPVPTSGCYCSVVAGDEPMCPMHGRG